jgi:hypothetical protein
LQNTPLHPIAERGRQRFGGADIPAERHLLDLENSLAQVKLDPAENAPLLAPLLDIPLPPERRPILAPEKLRQPTTPAMRREEIKLHVAFGNALTLMGDFVDGKEHYDRALAIYNPAEHGSVSPDQPPVIGASTKVIEPGHE